MQNTKGLGFPNKHFATQNGLCIYEDTACRSYCIHLNKGADSVDFALVNRLKPGDVVVTQDYGLASMCLAKCARVLNQNGLEYTADNMDALMLRRYENKKLLRAGKHPKGSPKRTKEQDVRFADTLEKTLSKNY